MTAADDAARVLALFAKREPKTSIERMALTGAHATHKRQARLAAYRDRNADRLRTSAREKAAERRAADREAAGLPPATRGRPRKLTEA